MGLNLADCVILPARAHPNRPAVTLSSVSLSFAELLDRVQRFAALLDQTGVRPGDRVVLLLPNTPHFPIAYYGTLYAGAVAVPLNPYQTEHELSYQFSDCTPSHIVVWDEMADTAKMARDASVPDAGITVAGAGAAQSDAGPDFAVELERSVPRADCVERSPDDVAVILYTAGYSGRPLGAQLTHFNIFHNAHLVATRLLKYTPEDRCLIALPLFHSFGQCVMMNASLLAGASVSLMPRFDAAKALDCIASQRITIAAFVPTMYHFLLAYRADAAPDLSSLRLVLAGGATMPYSIFDAFRDRFGHTILEGYGLTETSPVVSFNMDFASNRPGSVGLPLWGCEIRIADAEGDPLPAGEVGEVLVRGHNVMKGYLNAPDATAKTIRNGWLHTGDWGCLDEDGYLYLKGLKKDMLIRAGLNVYPREIERVLEEHPGVSAAAVVGASDPVRGEEPKAYVVLKAPDDGMEKILKGWCRKRLAGYKCPRDFTFVADLPRNPDGSLDKSTLAR